MCTFVYYITSMAQKVLFLTSAHTCFDDRIYYHQAITLANEGFDVKITSLNSEVCDVKNSIEFECYQIIEESNSKKISVFIHSAVAFTPNIIICSEPIAVFAAKTYSRSHACTIIYDITEWYPSKKHISNLPMLKKIRVFSTLALINIVAGFKTDAFIFGEQSKKFPFSFLFFYKKQMVLPYFPDSTYIYYTKKQFTPQNITLCYTGRFSREDGIGYFFEAVAHWIRQNPDIQTHLLLIGAPKKQSDIAYFEALVTKYTFAHITIQKPVPFTQFTQSIAEADICFDLREINFEYTRCLPIKYFYYTACGKPVIYSNLKALRPYAHNQDFAHLVTPTDVDSICTILQNYVSNPALYNTHATLARKTFEHSYSWQTIAPQFISFITNCIS